MGRRASSQSQTGNIQTGFGGYWILPLLLLPRVGKSGRELMERETFSVSSYLPWKAKVKIRERGLTARVFKQNQKSSAD